MASKSLAFLLLTACAVQCITALPSDETLKQSRDLQKDLEKIIDTLAELADKTINGIATNFQDILDKLQVEAKKVSDLLENAFEEAVLKISDLIEGAGKDVSACTDPALTEMSEIYDGAKVAADKCHEDTKANTNDILADAIRRMPDVAAEGKKLLDEFFACADAICKAKVLAKATVKNTEMTVEIGVISTKAIFDLTASSGSGAVCMNSAITSANLKIVKIVDDIPKCIKELK